MADITLADLLAWEPRLRPAAPEQIEPDGPELTWAVTARAMRPALPALRGGELVLLPEPALLEQEVSLSELLIELAHQNVAAVVLDQERVAGEFRTNGAPLTVLSMSGLPITIESESELNRLLTERRGELYRFGTELGRLLSSLTATSSGLQQILDLAFAEIAMSIVVTDRNGSILSSSPDVTISELDRRGVDPSTAGDGLIGHPLRGGGRIWLGPVAPRRRAFARIAADRLAVAVEAALSDARWFRSRGPAKAEALTSFVLDAENVNAGDGRIRAVALGLDPSGTFRVALSPAPSPLQALARAVAPYGLIHDLSGIDGFQAALVETKVPRSGRDQADLRTGAAAPLIPDGSSLDTWLALSAPVVGLTELAEGARQARYVAGLLNNGMLRRSVVRFDRATEIGSFRLLYTFWGRPDLSAFASEILGNLLSQDRNGVLRETLLHFLQSGGSRVEAAERAAIHRNTLAYRLRRITELTSLDPNNPDDRLSLHLAVLALSLPAEP